MKREIGTTSIVFLLVTCAVMGIVTLDSGRVAATGWMPTIVDSSGMVGRFTSLALDASGYPHISYYESGSGRLKYASWNGAAWAIEAVDQPDVGRYTSLALNGSGYPRISYADYGNNRIKFAAWNGTAWDIEVVDNAGSVNGASTSLSLNASGHPRIAYCDGTTGDLKYAAWNGTAWEVQTVDSIGDVGYYLSMALNASGYPVISYSDLTNSVLKYASWNGTAWNLTIVDSVRVEGQTSLVIDGNGRTHISYYDSNSTDLKCAYWTGTAWNITTVDSAGNVGVYSSMALNAVGYPRIAYFNFDVGDLKIATWNGTAWKFKIVDSPGAVGAYPSLKIGSDGLGHISYWDSGNQYLKYADEVLRPPEAPSEPWGASTGNNGILYTYGTITTDPDGDEIRYTFDWNDGNTSQTGFLPSGTSGTIGHSWSSLGTYQVRARATDVDGLDSAWSPPHTVNISAPPGAPQNVTTTPGANEVTITWDHPLYDGGYPVSNYRVYRGTVSNGETFILNAGIAFWYADRGLTNGVTYYYKVTAMNAVGEGPLSIEASARPATLPGRPTSPLAVPGNATINLSWSTPDFDGGYPITSYIIYRGTSSGSESFLTTVAGSQMYNDTGLTNGLRYYYVLAAVSLLGPGSNSSEIYATPFTVATEPLSLQALGGNNQVSLSWRLPASDSGSPVKYYRIYRAETPGAEAFISEAYTQSFVDYHTINGQIYYFKVSAVNSAGEGPMSIEVSATPRTVPSRPSSITATPGNAQVNLTWLDPSPNGGSTITNFRIFRGTTSGGETPLTVIGNMLTYTDTGLTNGVIYYYRVAAINSAGQGQNSTEVYATPATVPTAPLNLQAAPGNEQVSLNWSNPAWDGGSAVTRYRVYRSQTPGSEAFYAEVTTLSYVDYHIVNGQKYYFTVVARNSMGDSPQSTEVSTTPAVFLSPPSEVLDLVAVAGKDSIALSWKSPASNGGSPVTGYSIHRGTGPGLESLLGTLGNVQLYLDLNVSSASTYYYVVRAINAVGEGPQSNEAFARLIVIPNQLPVCMLITPIPGSVISGNYEVIGTASDPDGSVKYVQIRLDGGSWAEVTGNTSWTYTVNTMNTFDGQHSIQVRAFDGVDYSPIVGVSVTVRNAVPATTPDPKVSTLENLSWMLLVVAILQTALICIILLRQLKGGKHAELRDPRELEGIQASKKENEKELDSEEKKATEKTASEESKKNGGSKKEKATEKSTSKDVKEVTQTEPEKKG